MRAALGAFSGNSDGGVEIAMTIKSFFTSITNAIFLSTALRINANIAASAHWCPPWGETETFDNIINY